MPRFNDEEKKDLLEVLESVEKDLDDAVQFSEENGPKAITRKLERALILVQECFAKLDA